LPHWPGPRRRDLQLLEDQRLLSRTHGGAVAHGVLYELPLRYRAEASLDGLNLDLAIVGVDRISRAAGLTTHHEAEAHTNRALIERARRAIVVADGSKIGQTAFAQICPVAQINELITGSGSDPAKIGELREDGLTVTQVR
jgi:DeoR family transcriptional regulator of aga operon